MAEQIITVRLTADNIDTALLPGDVFTDDPEFGIVDHFRLGRNDHSYAVITTRWPNGQINMQDALGLPQTVRLTRTV